MNKQGLAKVLAEATGRTPAEADAVLVDVLGAMIAVVASGEPLNLTGFGSMDLRYIAPRKGRNPSTGKLVDVDATLRVRFRAGTRFARLASGEDPMPPAGTLPSLKLPKSTRATQDTEQATP